MEIIFTKHAEFKFEVLAEHGFKVTKEQIEDALNNPESVVKSERDRFIAQRAIDETHMIRVVYKKEGDSIKVITFYPARRQRYES